MSMLRNLAVSLINAREERIVTTLPKAKELRPFVEKAITLSRKASNLEGDDTGARALHLRRQAAGFFHAGNMQAVALTGKRGQVRLPRTAGVAALRRLFDELGERYKDRPGGYTRILKLGRRAGDNAELAIIELVDNQGERDALEAAKKRKSAGSKKKKATETKSARGSAAPKEAAESTAKVSDQSESIEASAEVTSDTVSEEPAETAAVDTNEPESGVTEES
jgi:large subunit ribosomal protein L17